MKKISRDLTHAARCAATGLMLAVILAVSGGASAEDQDVDINDPALRQAAPNVDLSPTRVVNIQMTALGQNGKWGDDQGIAVAFRFASPSNRRVTGPLERFVKLLENPVYSAMLDHKSVEIGAARTNATGDVAQVPVVVNGLEDERVGFMFTLSLQQPLNGETDEGAGVQEGVPEVSCECWMTDSVSRIELPQDRRQSI